MSDPRLPAVSSRMPAPRWQSVVLLVLASQLAWGLLLAGTASPLRALTLLVATLAAVAVVAIPPLGFYAIVTLLIGQWPWNLMRSLGALTVAATLLWHVIHGKRIWYRSTLLTLVAAFTLTVLISAIQPVTRIELRSQVLTFLGNGALVWLCVLWIDRREKVQLVVRLMVLAGIVTAIVGLVQWRTQFTWVASTTRYYLTVDEEINAHRTAMDLQGWQGQFRVDSITGTPDYMALTMQSVMPFVALWGLRAGSLWRRSVTVFVLILLGAAHVLSFTRGGLMTTFLVLLLLGWIVDKRRLLLWGPTACLVAAALVLSWSPLRERVLSTFTPSRMEKADQESTVGWRWRAIPVGVEMLVQRPLFGFGVGQQKWNWPKEAIGKLIHDPQIAEPLPIHNTYLLTGIELGFPGLGCLLVVLLHAILSLHRLRVRLRTHRDQELADVATALEVALVGLAVAMCMYPLVGNFRYFWLLIGLTAALADRIAPRPQGRLYHAYNPATSRGNLHRD